MSVDFARMQQVFLSAVEQHRPEDWDAYLDQACASDEELRDQVKLLLKAHLEAGNVPGAPVEGQDQTHTYQRPAEIAGTVIGPYKLVEPIGEGGMGTVWMAQQQEPVKRVVALKLIKAGMDSVQVVARFEAERQALALMDHPNIARVLDGGTTQSGRPYFVMDLVKGVPITRYCDEHHLTPRQRLELFLPVCQAVQHAHQKGIIHRDLKPSNVLVALYDGRPVPKVIDFGVAKAAGQPLTEKTLVTGFGAIVGTLEYMSPEQAEVNQLDIDTRSDIYSLGVLIYELLTGSTPFSKKDLEKAGMLEMLRVIREQEPSKPSTKLSTAEGLAMLAANRGTEPAKLTKLVRGELDWIVMKALEKDRSRRYETANGFAMDVQRYLVGEAVLAVPPSAGYRLRKLVRRNKGPIAVAAVVLLTLLGGIAGTTVGLVRAEQRAEGERRAKQEAQAREAETKAVLDFVERKIFAAARPEGRGGGLGRDVKLRTAVEVALPYVGTSFADQPLIEARLRMTLGVSFSSLGEAKKAEEQLEKARALRTKHLGPDHRDTLAVMNNLAHVYLNLGRKAEALKLYEETLALAKATLGPDHEDTLANMMSVAACYADTARPGDSLRLNEEVLAIVKAKHGPDDIVTFGARINVASCYEALGRDADALKVYEELLPVMRAKWPFHEFTFNCMNNLAKCYATLSRDPDALNLREELLRLSKDKLGPRHPDTLQSMHGVAYSYQALGRHDEAAKLFQETVDLRTAELGRDNADTLWSMHNLAISLAAIGRFTEALKLDQETLERRKARLGPNHADTLASMNSLGATYFDLRRYEEALSVHTDAWARQQAVSGPDAPDTLNSKVNVANSYRALERYPEAIKLYEEALAVLKARHPGHTSTMNCMGGLALSYTAVNRHADALKLRREVLKLCKDRFGPDHPATLAEIDVVADSLMRLDRGGEAVSLIDEVVRRAPDTHVHPRSLASLVDRRLRHFETGKDASGCRATAELWERLNHTDPESLYEAACFRAVTAAVVKLDPKTPAADAARLAQEQADLAMTWLHKAVAAGFRNAAHMKQDKDLDALREREDFKKLVAGLEAKKK